jgi:hypothetical protein
MEQIASQSENPMPGIDRRLFLQYVAASGIAVPFIGRVACARRGDTRCSVSALASAFANPPPAAGPGAYWYWLGGNVTREGITADLEAMRAAGIWTPMLFAIGKSGPDSPVRPPADALTPLWWELVEHATAEAARLGLVLALNCCDGWATASGPWITPELSMQHVVWTEQIVAGGTRFDGILTRPRLKVDYYRDITTIAVPHPAQWDETSFTRRAKVSSNLPSKVSDVALLSDPDNALEVIDTLRAGWIDYSFDAPFTLRSIRVHTPSPAGFAPGVYRAANSLEVQASDDGRTFRRIGVLEYPRHGWQTDLTTLTHAVPQTTARHFRLVHREIPTQPYEEEYDFGQDVRLRLFSIVLCSEPRIHHWQGKSGEQWAISRRTTAEEVPDTACVPLKDIIDLGQKVGSGGRLVWDAPPGRWRVLHIGYTTTGKQNSAAGGAQGLECDRFSAAATRLQFESWFGMALRKVGPSLAGKALHVLHVDSWEAGTQNWSPGFAAGFRELRGYDLLPYIATITGIPVESADVSERVLLDVRRTINDLMQTEFFQTLTTLAHEQGCLVSAEPPNPTFPADGMEHLAHVDWPMGEFWLNTPRNDKPTDIKDAVCGARLYGKQVAAAESFTQGLMDWDEHPFTFKALGDRIYCQGINRFMLHLYAQQPWLDRAPGMTFNGIGTFFSRTQTWWRPGRAWFAYLRRCQALLQEGLAVADVCYFTGENIPARTLLPRQVAMPKGYSYDCINRDGLLHQAEVRDGQLVLKSGGCYRVLIMPNDALLTPEVASCLRKRVRAGAVIIGPRPRRSPSLTGFPDADATVLDVGRELWGDAGDGDYTDRRVGAGRVFWGRPLEVLLRDVGVLPDVEIEVAEGGHGWPPVTSDAAPRASAGTEVPVLWTHRAGAGWDLYFLSNQSNTALSVTATFRVSGRRPELWHADSGEIEKLALWRDEVGRTTVPLSFDAGGSLFVLFAEHASDEPHITAISGANSDAVRLIERAGSLEAIVSQPGRWTLRSAQGTTRELEIASLREMLVLDGPWKLRFADRIDHPLELTLHTLSSWTEQADPDVKYYSGTADYTIEFNVPTLTGGHRLLLELGSVHDLAEVQVNGQPIAVLWKPPFTADITHAVRAGSNKLELAVTNTWRNRVIGDFGKPEGERKTFVVPSLRLGKPWLPGGPGTVLSPAGLLGPVRLRYEAVVTIG